MADAAVAQEWDASGKPITASPTSPSQPTEWDANGKPIQSGAPDLSVPADNKEGLYSMYGRTGQGDTVGEFKVPYSKVSLARQSGATFYNGSGEQYDKDKAGEGQPVSWYQKLVQSPGLAPVPNAKPREHVLGNLDRAALRTIVATPSYVRDLVLAAKESHDTGNPETILKMVNPYQLPKNLYDQFQSDRQVDPHMAVDNLIGSLVGAGVTAAAVHGAAKRVPTPSEVVGKVADKGRSILTGGTKAAAALNEDTMAANADAVKATAAKNASNDAAHLAATQDALHETAGRELQHQAAAQTAIEANEQAMQEHGQAVQVTDAANDAKMQDYQNQARSVEEENAKNQAAYTQDKAKADEVAKAAQDQETLRGQLARQVQEQSARMVERLRTVKVAAKAKADAMYDAVREKTTGSTVPATQLTDAVKTAQNNLQGSSESIKQFNDILSKYPDGDPDTLSFTTGSGGKTVVPRGHPIYDVLKAAGEGEDTPAAFNDLQGYYTELGDKLSGGNLPSDVYLAVKSLRDNIGGMMQKMASDSGAGALFKNAQNFYRDYYQTFREMTGPNHTGSPIANSLSAKDPAYAIKPLTVEETAQRVRNALSRFDPPQKGQGGAAKLYDNFRDVSRRFDAAGTPIKVPPQPTAPTPQPAPTAPTLQPRPTPPTPITVEPPTRVSPPMRPNVVQAQERFIGPEDIQTAKLKALDDRIQSMRKTSWAKLSGMGMVSAAVHYVTGLPIAEAGMGLVGGNYALARVLEIPEIKNILTKPTPADVAQINPAIARDLQPLIEQAKAKGIKISPAITAAVSAHATKDKWWDRQTP